MGRVRDERRPRLAPVRPAHQVHDALRHHLRGGPRPAALGAGDVGRRPLMVAGAGRADGSGERMTSTQPRAGTRAGRWSAGRGFAVARVTKERQPVLDRLAGASRRFQVHALVELDVTLASSRIEEADPRVSWTGFLIATVARAVAAHPEVNTRKAGSHVLSFDRVDIAATVERHWQGRTVLDIVVVTDADLKSCAEVTDML